MGIVIPEEAGVCSQGSISASVQIAAAPEE